jgi:hypothetical protein
VRVGGHRVHQPVRTELMRVVHQDRHPGLQVGPDRHALRPHVPLAQGLVLRPKLGDHTRDDRPVEGVETQAVQLEELGYGGAKLVGRRARNGGKPPIAREVGPIERTQMGLRVSDVDGEQHSAIIDEPSPAAPQDPAP